MADTGMLPVIQEAGFTAAEENELKARLFVLLTKLVRLRTQGDHSSLREEDAAELLDSIVFTLRYHLYRQGLPMRTLLNADLSEMLKAGQNALQISLDEAQALYRKVCGGILCFGSRSLQDTLHGIGRFFRCYDLHLYAHSIPVSIDYQLCLPVEEELRGVLYIHAYLERLWIENELVARFAQECVLSLLRRVTPDYRDLLVNLYEPVAANAVGLSLIGLDIRPLKITPVQAAQIHKMCISTPRGVVYERMAEAAESVCGVMRLNSEASVAYLRQTVQTLYPRIIISPQSAAGAFSVFL